MTTPKNTTLIFIGLNNLPIMSSLSQLSPLYSDLIGLTVVNISRIVFQARPHWSGLYGIISTM